MKAKINIHSITICAVFAALTAICSQISIPIGPVPVNLALLAVNLCAAVSGIKKGVISISVYIILGIAGLPVFAGFKGGIGVLAGPTGGYIAGYLICAAATALLCGIFKHRFIHVCISMAAGTALCYAFGTVWYSLSTSAGFIESVSVCVLPFLPGDVLKIIAAAVIAAKLRHILKKSHLI